MLLQLRGRGRADEGGDDDDDDDDAGERRRAAHGPALCEPDFPYPPVENIVVGTCMCEVVNKARGWTGDAG